MVEKAVESLLNITISLKPPERVAKVRSHLQKHLSHPIVKLLLPRTMPQPWQELPQTMQILLTSATHSQL